MNSYLFISYLVPYTRFISNNTIHSRV